MNHLCTADCLHRGLQETITIVVGTGDGQDKYIVPKGIMHGKTNFFTTLFETKPEPGHGTERSWFLSDEAPEVVKCFVYWLCRDRLFMPKELLEIKDSSMNASCGFFAKLWVLAERYEITALKTDVVDALLHRYLTDEPFRWIIIHFIDENTREPQSSIRKLLVMLAIFSFSANDLESLKHQGLLPPEFLFDMCRCFLEDLANMIFSNVMVSKDHCKDPHKHDFEGDGECVTTCSGLKAYD